MEDKINALYIREQNIFKSTAEKLVLSSNEIVHDNILAMFDNIDEINRKLLKFLKDKEIINNKYINKKKKESKYEELDSMLLKV